jgi:hypothetical protein
VYGNDVKKANQLNSVKEVEFVKLESQAGPGFACTANSIPANLPRLVKYDHSSAEANRL